MADLQPRRRTARALVDAVPALYRVAMPIREAAARGAQPSPVRRELALVLDHPVRGHVVRVDDARLLTGEGGWPALADLRRLVAERPPELAFGVTDDIVRIH